MTKDEALKLALVALDMMVTPRSFQAQVRIKEIYDSIREALAQPEQEPVAWMSSGEARMIHWKSKHPGFGDDWIPLYIAPPQREWQGLTDEEMHECWGDPLTPLGMKHARMIEAKLKEKNT